MTVSNRINSRMKSLDLTTGDIEKSTGLSAEDVEQFITGKAKPSEQDLEVIAKALKCVPEWLKDGAA